MRCKRTLTLSPQRERGESPLASSVSALMSSEAEREKQGDAALTCFFCLAPPSEPAKKKAFRRNSFLPQPVQDGASSVPFSSGMTSGLVAVGVPPGVGRSEGALVIVGRLA